MKKNYLVMSRLAISCITFIILFVHYSCKNSNENLPEGGETIICSGESKFSLIDTTFFAQSSLIALETTDNALIRNINAICIVNDTLFILDRSLKKIFIYDKKGKFIHVIQDIGNGPHEYASIIDICADRNQLIISCDNPYKIMRYNCLGQFIKEESLPDYFNNVAVANGRVYLYKHRSLGRRKLGIYSEQEQTIEEIQLPEGKYINAERDGNIYGFSSSSGRCLTASGDILCTWPLDYTIYTIEKGTPKAKYTIDFGKREIPQTLLEQSISPKDFLDMIDQKKYIYSMENVVENDSYLIFQTNPSIFILDKQKKKLTEYFSIENGVLGGGDTGYLAVNGSTMIAQVHKTYFFKMQMDNCIKRNLLPKSKYADDYLRIYKNLKEEDNPILCLYELPHK